MAITAIFATIVPAATAIGALAVWWAVAVPRVALVALLASLIAGQLVRLSLPGQGGGLLFSDGAILLLFCAALGVMLQRKMVPTIAQHIALLTAPFLVWSITTLIINTPTFGIEAAAVAAAYWIRLAAGLLLLPALLILFQDTDLRTFARRWFSLTVLALVSIGVLQLLIFPNLSGLTSIIGTAWDPHEGRLVASWLDPNFIGLFFALATLYMVFHKKYGLGTASALALIFTQSRSSLAAFIVTGMTILPIVILYHLTHVTDRVRRSVQIVAIMGIMLTVVLAGAAMLGNRLIDTFIDDPTVHLRLSALKETWQALGKDTALLGTGYNAYQFAAARAGIIQSFVIHSRAGSDNSFLTLWTTTGVIGILLFLIPWSYAGLYAWRKMWHTRQLEYLTLPVALMATLIHAQIVNSLLYSHIVITLALLAAFVLSPKYPKSYG